MPIRKQLIIKEKLLALYGGELFRQGNLLVCSLVPQLDGLFCNALRIKLREEGQLEIFLCE